MKETKFTIHTEDANTRLDRFLKDKSAIPFSLIQKLIRKKDIKVNNSSTKYNYPLKENDVISIKKVSSLNKTEKKKSPSPILQKKLSEEIKQNIIFKDKNIIAINKPYDVAVQGGSKIKISIADILPDLKFEKEESPRLVHRLDKHTSGLLILARTKQVAQALMYSFQSKELQKKYIALIKGKLIKNSGTLRMLMKKNTIGDKEKMSESIDGKDSITKFYLKKTLNKDVHIVEFEPVTGRTHQIRLHAAELLGLPILGDRKYGGKKSIYEEIHNSSKLHLAAYKMHIPNIEGKKYDIECPLPEHIKKTINELEIKD